MYSRHVINADLTIPFNDTGIPGIAAVEKIAGGLGTLGLVVCVIGLILGALTWSFAGRLGSPRHAEHGKNGVLISGGAATLIGSAVGLVNFFSGIHIG